MEDVRGEEDGNADDDDGADIEARPLVAADVEVDEEDDDDDGSSKEWSAVDNCKAPLAFTTTFRTSSEEQTIPFKSASADSTFWNKS